MAILEHGDTNTSDQMEKITIFLHEPNKFIYFIEQDQMPNNLKIEAKTLRKDYDNTITLTKRYDTSLSRSSRVCNQEKDYNWGSCLDEMFYQTKGKFKFITSCGCNILNFCIYKTFQPPRNLL